MMSLNASLADLALGKRNLPMVACSQLWRSTCRKHRPGVIRCAGVARRRHRFHS